MKATTNRDMEIHPVKICISQFVMITPKNSETYSANRPFERLIISAIAY